MVWGFLKKGALFTAHKVNGWCDDLEYVQAEAAADDDGEEGAAEVGSNIQNAQPGLSAGEKGDGFGAKGGEGGEAAEEASDQEGAVIGIEPGGALS